MKLTAAFLLIACLHVFARGYSQKVTLSLKNAPLKQAFAQIKKQTGFSFFWDEKALKKTNRVNISIKDASVEEAMNACLKDQPLSYSIGQNLVVIRAGTIASRQTVIEAKQEQPPVKITGTVLSNENTPLAGASVNVKGTNIGTTTDVNGRFSLDAPGDNGVLVVSYVGYSAQEISFSRASDLQITLRPAEQKIEEVVVVGYGTQKKINLSGSVASVSGATLNQSPAPTFTNLLQGQIAGLTVVQPTGEPGRDAGSLLIRGQGSYGSSSSPLVLVDGIVGSISNLSPDDIENVSVLKDAASSSIYGSRAANGVILITTKKGKQGRTRIEYTNNLGTSQATILPELITNSATYMEMYNAARQRSGGSAPYTQAQIDAYKNGVGDPKYPNTDWLDYYFHNGGISSHTLSLSGGNNQSTYYVSAGYQKQKGIIDIYDYDRYNSVIDYSTKVNKRVKVGTNINLSYQDIIAPVFTNDNLILLMYAQAPTFAPFLPDGSGRRANRDYASSTADRNRTAQEVFNMGAQSTKNYNINAQGYIDVDIIKGLSWKTTGAFVFFNQDNKGRSYPTEQPSYAFQPDAGGNYVTTGNGNPEYNGLRQSSARNLTLTVNSTFNYAKDVGADHHFNALLGYEQISNRSTSIGANRYNFISNSLNELNGGPTTGWENSGGASEYALQSLFGRVNYNYQGKYIVEGDIRYDGTSRVDSRYRWGTFGGASAAWRISEESFIKNDVSWISDLKLRASYGVLGNQDVYINGSPAYYPYQATFNNTQYPFAGSLTPGVVVGSLVTPNLHWEKTATTDFGIDLNILKGILGVTFDWYKKKTTDILAQQTDLPASLGLGAPVINAGAMENKGVELTLTHQNHIGEFNYGANFLIAINHNKVTKVLAPNKGVFEEGLPYNSFYLYVWDGIFQSQGEIDKSPAQPNSGNLKPGDIKIKDVTDDGAITPDDRVSISSFPKYTYSFGVNAGWKGFNLSAFFQGVEGQKFNVNLWGIDPFMQGTAPTTDFLNAWTPDNHSNTVPAIYRQGYAGVSGYSSTYYLKDASYLRLKNVNLSYTFSQKLLKVDWLKDLTLYVAGSNLITWTKYPGADPERAGSGRYAQFPQLKIFSGGLKISL